MTRPVLACMRCGVEGTDVRIRPLVDLEAEAKEDGERVSTVTVAVVTSEDRTGPRGLDYSEVPERYGKNEPRCLDRVACRDRVAASKRPAPPVEEEAAPWL